jgi:hypothetical protein
VAFTLGLPLFWKRKLPYFTYLHFLLRKPQCGLRGCRIGGEVNGDVREFYEGKYLYGLNSYLDFTGPGL